MIIPAAKTVFIDIPKTGSSSMVNFLTKAFLPLPKQSNVNPSWNVDLCPAQSKFLNKFGAEGNTLHCRSVRHEPIISVYKNIPDFHDYFFFTMVRNPFDRFKSFVYETLIHQRFKSPIYHFTSRDLLNSLYTDSWFVNNRDTEKQQFGLLIYHLNVIKSKGWNNINLCSLPLHMWPQVNFISLKTPAPYTLRILPFEQTNEWIDDFKTELSMWSGFNVSNFDFPNIDPCILNIYLSKSTLDSIKTMSYDYELLSVIYNPAVNNQPDPEFQAKYPTYDLFLQDYKLEKSRINDEYGPILEEHRDLIESVYHEDMVTLGYA
jgi:hypothetical protein